MTMKLFTTLGLFLIIPLFTLAQDFTYINSGTDGENHHPFYGLYDYSHNMYIFDQVDLGDQEKEIFELSFELSFKLSISIAILLVLETGIQLVNIDVSNPNPVAINHTITI